MNPDPIAIHQVALIFDDRLRPDPTGVYVRKALAGLVQVVHFQPWEGNGDIPKSRRSSGNLDNLNKTRRIESGPSPSKLQADGAPSDPG